MAANSTTAYSAESSKIDRSSSKFPSFFIARIATLTKQAGALARQTTGATLANYVLR